MEALRQNMIQQTCETKVVSKAGKCQDYIHSGRGFDEVMKKGSNEWEYIS